MPARVRRSCERSHERRGAHGNGLARDRRALAPFRVADGPPPKVRRLVKQGAKLTWSAPPRAARYAVAFSGAGGQRSSLVTAKRSVRIPGGSRTATVVALDASGRDGRPATIKLTARKPRKKK